ncbi:MAG TPA: alpha/beta hydrolase [Nitrososphaeraceae archaeon]
MKSEGKGSICKSNHKNPLLYTCISFVALMIFLSLNLEPYQVNAFNKMNQTLNLHGIETKKIRVDDIEMAYKIFGKGSPILLINGYSAPLDFWDPTLVERLASNHTVITFDNRGIGNTTIGNKKFSIQQFAQDTSGLMDALKIKKADIIGWSMGGMIAQELALSNPEKVGKLIIYASICGGNQSVPPSPEVLKVFANLSGSTTERLQKFLPLLFPDQWRHDNPNLLDDLPKSGEETPINTLNMQTKAITNWTGTCNRLGNITQPTMVLVGTDDVLTVPANSILISEKIPGAWLIQIKGGGHAMMMQYPEKFSNIVDTFLTS